MDRLHPGGTHPKLLTNVRDVVGIGMPNTVWAKALHHVAVTPPILGPGRHVMGAWVMDAAVFGPARTREMGEHWLAADECYSFQAWPRADCNIRSPPRHFASPWRAHRLCS